MFNNLSLKKKVLMGGVFPLLLLGIVNIIGILNFNEVIESFHEVARTHRVIELGDKYEKIVIDMQTSERGYLIAGDESFLKPHEDGEKNMHHVFNELKLQTKDEKALNILMKAEEILTAWEEIVHGYMTKRKSLDNTPETLQLISNLLAQKKGKKYFDQFRAEMDKFTNREIFLLEERDKEADVVTVMTNAIMVFGTLGALIVAILITLVMTNMIINPINMIKQAALKISKGETDIDISVKSNDEISEMAKTFKVMIKSLSDISEIADSIGRGDLDVSMTARSDKDELGKALVTMIANLNTIMSQIKEGTLSLNSAANEIFATTAQVATGASQTTAAVTQTSASIEQIKQTAKRSSAKALQTSESASKTIEIVKIGSDELLKNRNGLMEIKEKMDLIASNIINLSEQSQMISEIITTVEDIANQSNLLAVNASIEAIKAGEHGKGFSVVSQELKNLAEQSKQGTKQVQKIIFDIQKVTGTLVMVAEQGGKAVESGVMQAESVKTSMDQLNNIVLNAANVSKQIVASYEQELAGMDQISSAMGSIKQATMQNMDSIKQVEVSAKDLSVLSDNLKNITDNYTISTNK